MVCSNKQGLIHSQYPNSCLLVLEIILIQKKKKKTIGLGGVAQVVEH
jgi:hypothetical protein